MISYIGLKSFKCFSDQVIPLNKLTLFAGTNGTGKSTAIQSLLLLRQSLFNTDKTKLLLDGEYTKIGTARDALYRGAEEDLITFSINFTEQEDEIITLKYLYNKEKPNNHFLLKSNEIKKCTLPNVALFNSQFNYLTAERIGPRLLYPMSDESIDTITLGIKGEYTSHYLSVHGNDNITNKNLSLISDDHKIYHLLMTQTQLWMRKFVPSFSINVETIEMADTVRTEVRIYDDQKDYLRPTNIGFGILYTLPIVVAALSSKPNSLLIIENPEAHLHPAGQTIIGEFLARISTDNVQVIIETHSDHVLNGIRLAVKKKLVQSEDVCLNYFKKGSKLGTNEIDSPKIYPDGGIDYWPIGFFDQYEKDLRELI